jgi:hypothetical protein
MRSGRREFPFMADTAPHELPTVGESGASFNPLHAMRSVGTSLFVNGVCPYLLYRVLQSHYPAGSVTPLVYASFIPLLGLAVGLVRTRTVDFIALFALFEISYNIVTALAATNVHWAIILRSSEGFFVAAFFFIFTVAGYPPIFYIARQFAAGTDPAKRQGFAAANAADKGRTFTLASLVWVAGLLVQATLNLALALTVTPANYLLIAQFLNITANVLLVVWTIRFTTRRLERYRPPAAA